MEYRKEDIMEAKKQILGVRENMGTEESKKIWGLLLLDEGFRAAGMGGGMNTVDRNYLEYSSTPELAPDNLPLLRQHLCSWEDASALLKGNDLFRAYEPQLEARRNFLMGLSQRRMMLSRIRL